jgi:Na+-driven multidrug efflux pump
MRIEAICIVSLAGIGNAVSSYTAQNIGAHKQDRVVEGYHEAHKMILVYALLICLVLETLHRPIIALFLGAGGTAVAVSAGQDYLMFMGWFFYLIGFKMAVDGLLRGAGDMKMFTIANLANLFIRVLLAVTLAPRFGIAMIWYAAPIGWSINWIISFVQYRTEKWKHVNICIL